MTALLPTSRQVLFAERISEELGKPLPKQYTKGAYWKYINDNAKLIQRDYGEWDGREVDMDYGFDGFSTL